MFMFSGGNTPNSKIPIGPNYLVHLANKIKKILR